MAILSLPQSLSKKKRMSPLRLSSRFHVACNYRDSFDTLRKQECKRLKKELDESDYKEISHGMLWILRKDHDSLSPAERLRLRQLFQLTPCLHQAYTFRQELTAIFNRVDRRPQAEKALQAWSTEGPC